MEKCCICGSDIENYGNNPQGAAWKDEDGKVIFPEFKDGDRCCDMCDQMFVIPGRIYRMNHRGK